MPVNLRGIAIWILAALLLACLLIIGIGQASERVPQAGTVYLNETVDISGAIGWSSKIVWAGRYSTAMSVDNESILYSRELPDYKSQYYNYTIDYETFSNRLGWWYQYYGGYERSGNNRAFYVKDHRPITVVNNTTVMHPTLTPTPTPLPVKEKVVADYVAARGDPFRIKNFPFNGTVSVWIFGRTDGLFDRRFPEGWISFDAPEVQALEQGDYTLWIITPGENDQLDTRYVNKTAEYFDSETFRIIRIPSESLSPQVLLQKAKEEFRKTDDVIREYSLSIGDPYLEITTIESRILGNKTVLMRVKGYTNEIAGKTISFQIDKDAMTKRYQRFSSFSTVSEETGNPGALRYFDAKLLLQQGDIDAGHHSIEATTALGGKCNVDFDVYYAPQEVANRIRTVMYVGGNEFKPTPTPQIIQKVVTVEQIRYEFIEKPVTPTDEQVKTQHEAAIISTIMTSIMIIGGFAVILGCIMYARSVIIRAREKE